MNLKRLFILLLVVSVLAVLIFTVTQMKSKNHRNNKLESVKHIHWTDKRNDNLLKLKDLRYIVNPNCNNATLLTWIVTSYAGDPSPRSALRRAYSDEELQTLGVKRIFLLGMLDEKAEAATMISQNMLSSESNRYNDILQGNFIEAYKNLTYKHLMGLEWILNNCNGRPQYVMKTDDDIVVNLYDIISLLQTESIDGNKITGYVMKNMIPVREPANKWYVTRDEFTPDIYPEYISGWLYVTSTKTIRKLIHQSQVYDQYFWIDDVFITGILKQDLNIELQRINDLYATDYRYLNCCIEGKKKKLKCEFAVGPNGGDNELQVRFKEFVEYCSRECTKRSVDNSVKDTCVTAYEGEKLRLGHAQVQPIRGF